MRKFADQRIEWQGKAYTIPANRIMPLLARVEGIITFAEMIQFQQKKTIPQAKIAMAYGEVLRYCGINVEDEEVYLSLFPSTEDVDDSYMVRAHAAVQGLIHLMLPPDSVVKTAGNAGAPGKSGASSKKRIRRR